MTARRLSSPHEDDHQAERGPLLPPPKESDHAGLRPPSVWFACGTPRHLVVTFFLTLFLAWAVLVSKLNSWIVRLGPGFNEFYGLHLLYAFFVCPACRRRQRGSSPDSTSREPQRFAQEDSHVELEPRRVSTGSQVFLQEEEEEDEEEDGGRLVEQDSDHVLIGQQSDHVLGKELERDDRLGQLPLSSPQEQRMRFAFLDNIKALVVFAVVTSHVTDGFGVGVGVVPGVILGLGGNNLVAVVLMTIFAPFSMFPMPMMFFISGFFTPSSLGKKGVYTFLQERFLRLGPPLFLSVYVFFPVQNYVLQRFLVGVDELPLHAWYHHDTGPLWFVEALLLLSCWFAFFFPGGLEDLPEVAAPGFMSCREVE